MRITIYIYMYIYIYHLYTGHVRPLSIATVTNDPGISTLRTITPPPRRSRFGSHKGVLRWQDFTASCVGKWIDFHLHVCVFFMYA